jgi:hypothetical protein
LRVIAAGAAKKYEQCGCTQCDTCLKSIHARAL